MILMITGSGGGSHSVGPSSPQPSSVNITTQVPISERQQLALLMKQYGNSSPSSLTCVSGSEHGKHKSDKISTGSNFCSRSKHCNLNEKIAERFQRSILPCQHIKIEWLTQDKSEPAIFDSEGRLQASCAQKFTSHSAETLLASKFRHNRKIPSNGVFLGRLWF